MRCLCSRNTKLKILFHPLTRCTTSLTTAEMFDVHSAQWQVYTHDIHVAASLFYRSNFICLADTEPAPLTPKYLMWTLCQYTWLEDIHTWYPRSIPAEKLGLKLAGQECSNVKNECDKEYLQYLLQVLVSWSCMLEDWESWTAGVWPIRPMFTYCAI